MKHDKVSKRSLLINDTDETISLHTNFQG